MVEGANHQMTIIKIRVLPRASKNQIFPPNAEGVIKVKLTAAPVEGKANEALVEFLSEHYEVAKNRIIIKSGLKSKNKVVEIE